MEMYINCLKWCLDCYKTLQVLVVASHLLWDTCGTLWAPAANHSYSWDTCVCSSGSSGGLSVSHFPSLLISCHVTTLEQHLQ